MSCPVCKWITFFCHAGLVKVIAEKILDGQNKGAFPKSCFAQKARWTCSNMATFNFLINSTWKVLTKYQVLFGQVQVL